MPIKKHVIFWNVTAEIKEITRTFSCNGQLIPCKLEQCCYSSQLQVDCQSSYVIQKANKNCTTHVRDLSSNFFHAFLNLQPLNFRMTLCDRRLSEIYQE